MRNYSTIDKILHFTTLEYEAVSRTIFELERFLFNQVLVTNQIILSMFADLHEPEPLH